MKALTLIQPMAAAIVFDHPLWKDIENRPKNLPAAMRGVETTIALHAGRQWDDSYGMFVEDVFEHVWPPFSEVLGAVIGTVTFTGRVFTSEREVRAAGRSARWYVGPFGYEIKERRALATPVPCKGMLGFWTVPADVEAKVRAQLKPIGELIAASSVGTGLRDIEERGIDAHLADVEAGQK